MTPQLVCARGHVVDLKEGLEELEADGFIMACPFPVNGLAGKQVECGMRANWRPSRPEIKRARS